MPTESLEKLPETEFGSARDLSVIVQSQRGPTLRSRNAIKLSSAGASPWTRLRGFSSTEGLTGAIRTCPLFECFSCSKGHKGVKTFATNKPVARLMTTLLASVPLCEILYRLAWVIQFAGMLRL